MHAVDTNVVVRYLTGDDPIQAEQARAIIDRQPVLIPRTVLLEVEWVLRSGYKYNPIRIVFGLRAMAGLPNVSVEDAEYVANALDWTEAGLDFADALHLAAAAQCVGFLTFDAKLARDGLVLTGIPVAAP